MRDIKHWFDYPTKKTLPYSGDSGQRSFKAHLAQNECESIQFVISSDEFADGLALELSDFHDKDNGVTDIKSEILRVHYIETKNGEFYPDPVVPLSNPFALDAGKNQAFLVKIKSTRQTVAGEYFATLTLKASGRILSISEICVKVWNFALPDTPSCATFTYLNESSMQKAHNAASKQDLARLYKKYYDFLLDSKVSAAALPCDILSSEADAYIDDPRVTSFVIPYDEGKIEDYHKKLRLNPNGLKKGVFYPLDEPTEKKHYDRLLELWGKISALYPNYRIVTPFYQNIKLGEEADAIDIMSGKINVWCPKSYMFDNINIYDKNKKISEMPFSKRMDERKSAGDDIWWYVCWEPGTPFCNLYVDMPGIMHRMLFWQQKLYNVDGFLYWCANYWEKVSDPWEDMCTLGDMGIVTIDGAPFDSSDVFGDGSLLYNGNKVGIDGPVGSIRLENIRKGIDDFEYLCIAEKLFGRECAVGHINKITSSLTKYALDDIELANARIELGNKIEAQS